MANSTRTLRRPRQDRVLAGVCSGLGYHFGIDPAIIRIGWVLFVLLGGSGVLAYLIAWMVIPDELGQRNWTPLLLILLLFILPVVCGLFLFVSRTVVG
jgi:phage shock protein C